MNQMAKAIHEGMREFLSEHGESIPEWDNAPQWMKDATFQSIRLLSCAKTVSDNLLHDDWMKNKIEDGWVYGPVKDDVFKTHPCLVPFEELSPYNKAKDTHFIFLFEKNK